MDPYTTENEFNLVLVMSLDFLNWEIKYSILCSRTLEINIKEDICILYKWIQKL